MRAILLGVPVAVLGLTIPGLALGQVPLASCKNTAKVTTLAYSPDGKAIAVGTENALRIWDAGTCKELRQMQGVQGKVTSVLYAPDGRSLAAGLETGMVSIWDVGTNQQRMSMSAGRGSAVAIALAPDGRNLASGGQDRRIFMRDVVNGVFLRVYHGHTGNITGLSIAPAGGTLASSSADNTVRIWDVATGREVLKLTGTNETFNAVQFSPDGKRLVTGAKDAVQVWDPTSGKEVLKMAGHKGHVTALAFSKDGKMLATTGEDGAVQLWDPATGKLLRLLGRHRGAGRTLAFNPGGKTLASGGDDNLVLIWDVSPRIFLPPKPVELTDKDLNNLWENLAVNDFAKAGEAIGTLAASRQAVPFLSERLRKLRPQDEEKRISALIQQLDDDRFAVREKATVDLEHLGPIASPQLEQSLKGQISLEARRRSERILEKLKTPELTPDQHRLQRAVSALELMATPEARKLLEELARGSGGAWLALEARSSIERLERTK